MIARDIMTRTVYTIRSEATAQEVAQLLAEKRISGVPVVDERNNIIGIVTEADIISKVTREERDESTPTVADLMSREVITVHEEMPASDIAGLLTERRIKRVPVVSEGKLTGIVSRGDIVRAVAEGHLIIRQW